MAGIDERIAQARTRLETAQSNENTEVVATAQAELDRLLWVKSEGFVPQDEVNGTAITARGEGRTTGETQARRAQAERLGVSLDNLDAELDRLAEIRRNDQSEAERLRDQQTAIEVERDTATREREEARSDLERYRVDEAITQALDAKALRPGKRSMALRAIDRSSVSRDDSGNLTGVTEAVDALVEEEAGWFSDPAPENPPETPESRRASSSGTQGGESHARKWANRSLAKNKAR